MRAEGRRRGSRPAPLTMGTGRREVAYRKGDSLEAFNAELAVASMRGQGLAERRLSAEWNGTDQWGWISDLGSDARG